MRRTATPASFLRALLPSLVVLLLGWLTPRGSQAQASQGQVADSLELRALRDFFTSTNGSQWNNRTGWPTRASAWDSATVAQAAGWYGVQVSGGDVTGLVHINNNLNGPLPASLGQLRALQSLNLQRAAYAAASSGAVSGPLPKELGQLTQLRTLAVRFMALEGNLPPELSNCQQLTYLDFINNHLSGPIPPQLGQLSQLTFLCLDNWYQPVPSGLRNAFTGGIPKELGQLRSLVTLELDMNPLGGTIPPELGQLQNLQFLELENCHLTGSVPAAVLALPKLTNLLLGYPDVGYSDPNTFSSLPAPSLMANPAGLRLLLGYNQFDFGQLEPYFSGPGQLLTSSRSSYLPQSQPVVAPDTVAVLAGQAGQLAGQLPGQRNAYQWQRLVGEQWTDMPGQTQPQLSWPRLTTAETGTYRARVSNDYVTGLTLFAPPHYLDVRPYPAPAANRPDDTNRGLALLHPHAPLDSAQTPPADMNYVRTWVPRVALTAGAGPAPTPGSAVHWEQWQQLPGIDIYSLPLSQPADAQRWLPTLEAPTNIGVDYGARLSAYLVAPQTGPYSFWVAGDDVSELWLSPDADPAHVQRIAYAYHFTDQRQWRRDSSQHSAPVRLVAGQRYYVEVRHKQAGGADFVAAAWTLPDGTFEGPIAGAHLAASASDEPSWGVAQARRTTQYLDGLGRVVQTVQHQASPQRRDLVLPQAYDGLGREPKAYLPFAADSTQGGRLGYHAQALTSQQRFYLPSTQQGPLPLTDPTRGVARTGAAFAETQFEASPLNRVTAQGAAGEAWQLTNGHISERRERPNVAADSVPRFAPGYDPTSLDPGYQGTYAAGERWGVLVHDPHGPAEVGAHGYQTIEWKDKLGQVVCKQVEAARAGRNDSSRWLRTAYAYDDFQHLRFVLQPEAVKRVLALGDTVAALPAACLPFEFHYRYDARGRQIAKQVPGQEGETLVVYDQLDRPVLSQDAAQRTRREWSWSKYDALGRLVLTGLTTRQDTLGQVSLQTMASADTATVAQYEQRTADTLTYRHGLTTDQSFPHLARQGFAQGQVLTVSYYDDYDFNNDGRAEASYTPSLDAQFASGPAPVADALRTTGMPTRSKTRVLGVAENDPNQAAWLVSTTFYDERARPVQVQSLNARKGLDVVTMQLDFLGKVVQSVASHQGPHHDPVVVRETMRYDHAERLLATYQQLPGEARAVPLSRRAYNELGQLLTDTLASGRLRQLVDYAYNIRGWLTSLNDPYGPTDPTDLFHLSLHYEAGFTKGYEQYNGNLTGQTWRGRDGVQRAYGYVYDPLNRLLQGDYVARAGGRTGTLATATAWNQESDNYRLSFVSYDDNGNILTLRRQGLLQAATHNKVKQYGAVDNLAYAYQGNRLLSVDDAVSGNQLPQPATYHGAPTSLAGDFQEAGVRQGQEYLYDANGNLTQDQNKGITGIAYNYLNLPRQIHFGQVGDSVVFRYSAAGQKVAKLVYQTGKSTPQRTDYLGPYQYEQDSLRFFPHAAGRVLRFVSKDPAGQATVSYQREFTVKDHLGNLRLAYRAGQVRRYLATLEQDSVTHRRETQQFDSLSVSTPIAVSTTYSYGGGSWAARLNAGGSQPQPLGPLTQLAVQRGDTLRVSVAGLYPQKVSSGSTVLSLLAFVADLLHPSQGNPPASVESGKRGGLPLLQIGLSSAALQAIPTVGGGVPRGYLRVLCFNADSALVYQRVFPLSQAAEGGFEVLGDTVHISHDGYVSVYVGNESNVDVFFDQLAVEHHPGLLVQETQYDPAGLELAGLAPPSPGIRGLNNYRFNGKEFQPDLGLNWNHQDWRFFDPQLLRWHAGDPEIENGQESWTPYSFGYDNAVRYADANGRAPEGQGPGKPDPNVVGTISSYQPNGFARFSNLANSPLGATLLGPAIPAVYDVINTGYAYLTGFFDHSKARTLEGHGLTPKEYQLAGFSTLMTLGGGATGAPEAAVETVNAERGGLNLFRFGAAQTDNPAGWKPGDRMLKMYDRGNPKANWKQNSGFLRQEMSKGKPIYDSYRSKNGAQIPSRVTDPATGKVKGAFLNAERKLLESRGWTYNQSTGAYMPPPKTR